MHTAQDDRRLRSTRPRCGRAPASRPRGGRHPGSAVPGSCAPRSARRGRRPTGAPGRTRRRRHGWPERPSRSCGAPATRRFSPIKRKQGDRSNGFARCRAGRDAHLTCRTCAVHFRPPWPGHRWPDLRSVHVRLRGATDRARGARRRPPDPERHPAGPRLAAGAVPGRRTLGAAGGSRRRRRRRGVRAPPARREGRVRRSPTSSSSRRSAPPTGFRRPARRHRIPRARSVRRGPRSARRHQLAACRRGTDPAFDHDEIVKAARDRLPLSSPTPTSASLAPREFTISMLREHYAAALGHPVSATNLQRVLARRAVLVPTGRARGARAPGGRRRRCRVRRAEPAGDGRVRRAATTRPAAGEARTGGLTVSGGWSRLFRCFP